MISMVRVLSLILIGMCLVSLTMEARPVAAQTPPVQLLDVHNAPLTTLVDGNSISVQINLPQAVSSGIPVEFRLAGSVQPIAGCTIAAGQISCQSARFSTLGWAWDRAGAQQRQRVVEALAAGQPLGQSALVTITPRPVVMVHGYIDSWEGWAAYLGADGYLATMGIAGYAVGDGQAPGVMDTGAMSAPWAHTNTVAQNAEILGAYIDRVQQITGAEQVDLLVHSMGGIIARYYLDRVMLRRTVAQLIILGSPMGGSTCSMLPAALGLLLPATLELQPSYMQAIFNPQITRRQGVPFHALAGTKLHEAVQSPCTDVPSDLVVSLASSKAIAMPIQEQPLLHSSLNDDPEVFTTFVRPLLQTPPGPFWQVADPPLPPPTDLLQFTRVYTGHLQPGETETVTIHIDPGVTVATFALYDTSRSLTTEVTGASGKRLQLEPATNGEIRVTDPASMVYLGYGFVQPRAGQWLVALQTTADTPVTGADYAIAAQFKGGATLQTTVDILAPLVNAPVTIQAQLTAAGQPLNLTNARARVHQPDGQVATYPLALAGDRTTLILRPTQRGLYGVELNVNAQTADGLTVDRAAFTVFEAHPAATTPFFASNLFLPLVLLLLPFLLLLLLPLLLLLLL